MRSDSTNDARETVVLLHGLGRSRFSMSVLGRFLKNNGFAVFNFGYPSRSASVGDQADSLLRALTARFTSDAQLSFVTHSLGSIVVHHFASQHFDKFVLKRAVMLGPPNQGAQMARLVGKVGLIRSIIGPALRDVQTAVVRPASDKLEIGVIAGGGRGARGISPLITGDNDAIVSVEETKIAGMRDHIVVNGLHSFLMYQPRVHTEVLCFLKNGRFSTSVATEAQTQ